MLSRHMLFELLHSRHMIQSKKSMNNLKHLAPLNPRLLAVLAIRGHQQHYFPYLPHSHPRPSQRNKIPPLAFLKKSVSQSICDRLFMNISYTPGLRGSAQAQLRAL